MPKNTFFEGTKKIFCAKNFLGLFVHMYKGGLCKKNNTDCIKCIRTALKNLIQMNVSNLAVYTEFSTSSAKCAQIKTYAL